MKSARKYAVALAIAVTGSVLCGNLPATAGGIELDKVDIVFSRNHDDAYGPGTPPPPQGQPQAHMPPPPGGPGGPGGPRGHMPPPPSGWDRHGFAGGPGGHMPPQHPGGPRGHMPPPNGHMPPPRW